jgi:hypothetical protein
MVVLQNADGWLPTFVAGMNEQGGDFRMLCNQIFTVPDRERMSQCTARSAAEGSAFDRTYAVRRLGGAKRLQDRFFRAPTRAAARVGARKGTLWTPLRCA